MNLATAWQRPALVSNPSSAAAPLSKKHCNVGLTDRTCSRLKQQVRVFNYSFFCLFLYRLGKFWNVISFCFSFSGN